MSGLAIPRVCRRLDWRSGAPLPGVLGRVIDLQSKLASIRLDEVCAAIVGLVHLALWADC